MGNPFVCDWTERLFCRMKRRWLTFPLAPGRRGGELRGLLNNVALFIFRE